MDIQAAFEKAYWKLEPTLPGDKKDLTAATLRSIARTDYIERKGPKPPKTLLKSTNKLKRRDPDDIVITKPGKGSGLVVMDKSEYLRLLCEASVNDSTKFKPVGLERPPTRGRPSIYLPWLEVFALSTYLERSNIIGSRQFKDIFNFIKQLKMFLEFPLDFTK